MSMATQRRAADAAAGARPVRGAGLCRRLARARGIAADRRFALLAFLPGFFQIPPIDRDEARFAQATKQMMETGDYVDIRFQDEVRYKKPVGIYWLQAVVGESGARRSACRRRAPPSGSIAAVADRRDRRGAADLLDGARLRLAARRGAGGADDGELRSCSASRRGSPRPTPCCCSPCVAAMGAMARIYLDAAGAAPERAAGLATAGDLLDRAGGAACCSRGR